MLTNQAGERFKSGICKMSLTFQWFLIMALQNQEIYEEDELYNHSL